MNTIVCKFGGTSCANAESILKVEKIIKSDKNRKFIVVSAPGKRHKSDIKITDLLFACHDELQKTGSCKKTFLQVEKRFLDIADSLKIGDIQSILNQTKAEIESNKSVDFTSSRGEYLNAICIAKRLNLPFIDAKDVIFFDTNGSLDEERTYAAIEVHIKGLTGAILPGFYGTDVHGHIKTFSRGGSDISGAILARGVNANLYENWTDVDGFLACDPRIVPHAKKIDSISFKELRELSYMGANVLHADSTFPLRNSDITIQIKNTFNPMAEGTSILPLNRYVKTNNVVTGIAGKKDFSILYMEKAMMNGSISFANKVLTLLKEENINIEYMPSGIDTLSLIIKSKYLQGDIQKKILKRIEREVHPDILSIKENIAVIAAVGHGMQGKIGASGRVLQAIGRAGVNIKIIDKSSSEMNIIVGVDNLDYEKTIQTLYKEFFA